MAMLNNQIYSIIKIYIDYNFAIYIFTYLNQQRETTNIPKTYVWLSNIPKISLVNISHNMFSFKFL